MSYPVVTIRTGYVKASQRTLPAHKAREQMPRKTGQKKHHRQDMGVHDVRIHLRIMTARNAVPKELCTFHGVARQRGWVQSLPVRCGMPSFASGTPVPLRAPTPSNSAYGRGAKSVLLYAS